MRRWTLGILSGTALAMTMTARASAQPLDLAAKSNTRGFSVGVNLNGSAIRSPSDVAEKGAGFGLRLSYGVNQKVAVYFGVDAAALSMDQVEDATAYSAAHADLGVRFALADSTSATVPYVEGAYSGRAMYQEALADEIEITGNAATFGGGIEHFFSRRIALDAGVLFSYGKFTDAKVNGESFSDNSGDSVWSSRFNLGLRMHFR